MPYLKPLDAAAGLLDVLRTHPDLAKPLLELQQAAKRGPSAFTVAERELMAAYVSGLNACDYCHGVHSMTATSGVPWDLLSVINADPDAAPVDPRMKPVLRNLGRLTRSPAQVSARGAESVFAAGWHERALHDAAMVCGIFNLMNQMVLGSASKPPPTITACRRIACTRSVTPVWPR